LPTKKFRIKRKITTKHMGINFSFIYVTIY
jgi:hypothetical protein